MYFYYPFKNKPAGIYDDNAKWDLIADDILCSI